MAVKRRKTQLSIEQMNAIDLLVLGTSDKEVAEAVGVHRTTIWLWRSQDPLFIAELNRRRNEVWRRGADKLRALIPKALAVLEEELANADNKDRAKIALEILRLCGVEEAGSLKIGPEDPDEIAYQMLRDQWREPKPRGLREGIKETVPALMEAVDRGLDMARRVDPQGEIRERVRARVKGAGAPDAAGTSREWF
jgi:hypothetical protein